MSFDQEENPCIHDYPFFLLHINWRIITLQYCDGLCIDQHELATGIHVSPPSWIPLPPPSPSHHSRLSQSTDFGFPVSYIKLTLAIYFTYSNVYVSVLLSHPFLFPLSLKVCSLYLCLVCCPACRIVNTIFLDSIYMRYYMIFVFLFLSYFTV